MEVKDIAQRISYFRNKKGMTAQELSQMIGKSNNYIGKLECYNFNLPSSVLLTIIDALAVTAEEFFADNFQTYQKDKELYNLIKVLPQEKKEALMKFILS